LWRTCCEPRMNEIVVFKGLLLAVGPYLRGRVICEIIGSCPLTASWVETDAPLARAAPRRA